MELKLYHRWECPYSAKVRNFIDQYGLGSQLKFVELNEMPNARDELRELAGKTQVPCLVVDNNPMFESDDIIQWLRQNLTNTDSGHATP